MTRTKAEAESASTQATALARHYRAIGPAAIVAALMAIKRKPAKTVAKAA